MTNIRSIYKYKSFGVSVFEALIEALFTYLNPLRNLEFTLAHKQINGYHEFHNFYKITDYPGKCEKLVLMR